MSKPRRQHFIPKSYLRQFSDMEGDKAFVEAYNVNSGELKYPFSIANLCVSKNIYTLPAANDKDKYSLEHFYAENVDAVYPEVYKILTDHKVIKISEEQRQKILYTTLSLYFRTSRFLDEKNDELDWIIERISKDSRPGENAELFLQFGGRGYKFLRKDIENVKDTIRIANRTDFIFGHLEKWQDFVKHKYDSQIGVSYILGDVNLISCDNPVKIDNHKVHTQDVFDPDNSIQLPLDQKHLLWISPNSKDWNRDMIYRGVRDKWFAITSNHSMQKDATDWIFSKKGCISKYFEEQKKYDNFEPENLQALEDIKTKVTEMNKFLEFVKVHGMTSEASLKKLRELKEIPALAKDPQFNVLCLELRLNGFDV
jgi:hypothetical protein